MIEMLGNLSPRQEQSGRIYGIVVGIVTNNQDPDKLGRVKVKFPWLSEDHESHWARVATLMAGPAQGVYFLPELDDEVLVMFEHGYVDHPFVIGAVWNGKATPPTSNADGKNNIRMLKSRSGHTVTLDDTDGAEKITVSDKGGKNSIVLDAAKKSIEIRAEQDLNIKAAGVISLTSDSDIAIKCNNFSVKANSSCKLTGTNGAMEATAGLAIKCMAGVKINDGALEVT